MTPSQVRGLTMLHQVGLVPADAMKESARSLDMQDKDGRIPAQENRAIVIDDLVKLIEGMDPFLDCSGRAFCSMPHSDPAKRGKLPLRDRQVRSVLSFRYWEEHQTYPGRERVNEAIEYFEGKLLTKTDGLSSRGQAWVWTATPKVSPLAYSEPMARRCLPCSATSGRSCSLATSVFFRVSSHARQALQIVASHTSTSRSSRNKACNSRK